MENPLALIEELGSPDRAELADVPLSELERAVAQGEAWAEREEDAAVDLLRGDWYAIAADALPLIDGLYDPSDDDSPTYEQRTALAELCVAAARAKWERITADAHTVTYYYHAGAETSSEHTVWSGETRDNNEDAEAEARNLAQQHGGRAVVEYWDRRHGERPGDCEAVEGCDYV